MSLEVLTRGGGTGGASASIFVTGLSETNNVSATEQILAEVPNPEWAGLPDEYTQLAYIESTGTQYIDTGIKISSDIAASIDFQYTSTTANTYGYLFGDQSDGLGYNMTIRLSAEGTFHLEIGELQLSPVAEDTDRHTAILNAYTGDIYLDNVNIGSGGSVNASSNNIYVFDSDGSVEGNRAYARIFSLKLYNGNTGVLYGDFIPCYIKATGEAGLYDTVNDVFYTNAGSGTFLAGEKVPQYIIDYVDGKTVNGVWAQKANPAVVVPDGYTQLEYIESTGTQYIDTEYVPNQNTNVSVDFEYMGVQSSTWYPLFGVLSNPYYFSFVNSSSGYSLGYGTQEYYPLGTYSADKKTVEIQNGSLLIDGATVKTASATTFTATNSIFLFTGNSNGSPDSRITQMRCYSFVISQNSVLVRNYIPAKRNSDSAIGLYDTVNDVFYENAGTGVFTAGAEIPATIDGFSISPIKKYGTWKVTASLDGEVAEDTVEVDEATEYSIEMSFRPAILWLYNEGDECSDITGGWGYTGYTADTTLGTNITKNSTNVYIVGTSGKYTLLGTLNAVDISQYKTLHATCKVTGTYNGNVGQELVVYQSKDTTSDRLTAVSPVNTTDEQEIIIDISESDIQEAYITILTHGTTSYSAYFYKIWLE